MGACGWVYEASCGLSYGRLWVRIVGGLLESWWRSCGGNCGELVGEACRWAYGGCVRLVGDLWEACGRLVVDLWGACGGGLWETCGRLVEGL